MGIVNRFLVDFLLFMIEGDKEIEIGLLKAVVVVSTCSSNYRW